MAALTLGIAFLVAPASAPHTAAQGSPAIGIDADPQGNGPNALAGVDSCISVATNERFDIDVFIRDVDELLAWEIYVEYDPELIEIVGRDVQMFLASNPGSTVLDVSNRLPSRDGLYRAAAADTADPPAPDSGSGSLFRLTLKALAPGKGPVQVAVRDLDGDGDADIGPLLRNVDGDVIGDTDGNALFDGPIQAADVAVDTDCPEPPPTPTPSHSSDGDSVSPTLIGIVATGGALLLLVSGFALRRLRRRRKPAE